LICRTRAKEMSDEYRDLEERINRMAARKERAIKAINDLKIVEADLNSIVAEVDTDIQAMQLQRDALAAAGDSGAQ
jgi:chromosome segregation ATPase